MAWSRYLLLNAGLANTHVQLDNNPLGLTHCKLLLNTALHLVCKSNTT